MAVGCLRLRPITSTTEELRGCLGRGSAGSLRGAAHRADRPCGYKTHRRRRRGRRRFKGHRTEDEHSASTYGGPEKLAELICKGLPAYYKTELRNLKKAKKQDAKISNPKMSNAELNAMFGHKWIPELGVLTEEMSQAYRDRCGAFVFVCLATGTIQCKPYSSKSQFCVLLKR